MAGTQYQRSAQTQQKLIHAVIQLAHEKNYETITVQEICRTANVSTGSFYHQFGSKEGLVKEAYRTVDWLLTEEFVAQYRDLPPIEALDCLLRRYLSYVEQEIGVAIAQYYKVLLSDAAPHRYDMQRPYCQEVRRILTRAIQQGILEDRYDPEDLTYAIMRLIRGLLVDWAIQGGSYDLFTRYALDFQIFLRGLTPPR